MGWCWDSTEVSGPLTLGSSWVLSSGLKFLSVALQVIFSRVGFPALLVPPSRNTSPTTSNRNNSGWRSWRMSMFKTRERVNKRDIFRRSFEQKIVRFVRLWVMITWRHSKPVKCPAFCGLSRNWISSTDWIWVGLARYQPNDHVDWKIELVLENYLQTRNNLIGCVISASVRNYYSFRVTAIC